MYEGQTVLAQVMSVLSHNDFRRCVNRYHGNDGVRQFRCWDQFVAMSFAQLTHRESLRDIEVCLEVQRTHLYHSGLRGPVKRTTLAIANERRDWRIYRDVADHLLAIARPLYAGTDLGIALKGPAYAFDSTTIDLCLSLFPWAHFRRTKSAVKLHTLLDLRGSIPTFVAITKGNVADVRLLDELRLAPGSLVVLDRGYVDFQRLYRLTQSLTFFVIRAKSTFQARTVESHPVEDATGVRRDETIRMKSLEGRRNYPTTLRRVVYYSVEMEKELVFLTNNFDLPALDVASLYRYRWRVELFFKWIKQHLRVKKFFGTSENSVKTQIWIAIATYLLVAILKKRLDLPQSLYTILQTLSLTLFEKMPILSLFQAHEQQDATMEDANQLILFDL